MNKKLIRLTESDLHRIIKESVNMVLKEAINNNDSFLYRWITLGDLMDIIESDSIKSTPHEGYNFNDDVETTHNGICFTRDKEYRPYVEYEVQMVFPVQNLLNKVRGVKLIPYQDSRWDDLDEYEERLISKNGKDFEIANISEIVSSIYIHIDDIIENVFENGDYSNYKYVIRNIEFLFNNNIFGDKLKFLYDFKETNIKNINDFENFMPKVIDLEYCVRRDDGNTEDEYFSDIGMACAAAKRAHDKSGCSVTVIESYDKCEIRVIARY
jgi:hypothetical protein